MLVLENVYSTLTPGLKQQVAELWVREGAISAAQIEERLSQVVFIVRDSETGELVGVSTADKKRVHALNSNYFYEFRCFIADAFRVAGLDVKLSRETFDYLAFISKQDLNKPIGIFTILENEGLKKLPVWRRAVWPEIEMYFVGYTTSGNPIRVHYFKEARI